MATAKSTLTDRFWSKVEKLPCEPGCWLWASALHSAGYGVLNVGGAILYAHRLAFADANGLAYETTEHVHHKCHVRSCVNPAHLEGLTAEQHMALHGEENSPDTCQRGHSMADAYERPDGTARMCRECCRERARNWSRAHRVSLEPKACSECGATFVPTRKRTQETCSHRCIQQRFYRRKGITVAEYNRQRRAR